jgi:hypothetical protein
VVSLMVHVFSNTFIDDVVMTEKLGLSEADLSKCRISIPANSSDTLTAHGRCKAWWAPSRANSSDSTR